MRAGLRDYYCASGCEWLCVGVDAMAGIFGPQPSEEGEDGGELLLLERGGSPQRVSPPRVEEEEEFGTTGPELWVSQEAHRRSGRRNEEEEET